VRQSATGSGPSDCELCGERHEAPHRLAHAAQDHPGVPVVTRKALAAAWRAVGATDEAQAAGTVARYWWRRALRERARHAAPDRAAELLEVMAAETPPDAPAPVVCRVSGCGCSSAAAP
jgi:hypothetical protein